MVVLEAPIFDGRPGPWTFIIWLDEMDQFFDQICLPDANKARLSRLKLRSRARDFWRSIENNLKGRSKPAITDWNEMKQMLREKYVPQCYQETIDNLRKRKVCILDCCYMCKCNSETIDHLFLHCLVALELWGYGFWFIWSLLSYANV